MKNKHLFSKIDLDKILKISWKERFILFFKPMKYYISFDPGLVKGDYEAVCIYYKELNGKKYIYDIREVYDRNISERK